MMTSVQYGISGSRATEIASSIERGIRAGTLVPSTLLPPVRTLAAELGVANGTVAAAYRTLRDAGLVVAAGRAGTRVREQTLHRRGSRVPVPEGAVDLSTGQPDPDLLPRLPRLDRDRAFAPPDLVLPELADRAAEGLGADGVPTDALTLTHGALDGIERVLAAHLRPGDAVAVEDPGWPNLLDLLAGLGLRALPVAVDQDGPDPQRLAVALAAGAKAVVVTSRAQNPTGGFVAAARAGELKALLTPEILVLEDDHAGELAGVPLSPLCGLTDRWAFVRSVSKAYGPDLRLAVLAGDPTTVGRVEGRMRLGAGWVSSLLQHTVLALWEDEQVKAQIRQASATYRTRREALVAALAPYGIDVLGHTGINAWVPVADETATVSRLLLDGFVVAPGSRFRLLSAPGIRITLRDLDPVALARSLGADHQTVGRPT